MTPQVVTSFWEQAGESRWFLKDPAFDGALRVRFGKALAEARNGAFDTWGETPEGALGLVILLDQVSRNIVAALWPLPPMPGRYASPSAGSGKVSTRSFQHPAPAG